jgi:preprotein translocase subunit SecF
MFVATPVLTMLKEREPRYRNVREKVLREAKRAAPPVPAPDTGSAVAAAATPRPAAKPAASARAPARPRTGSKKARRRKRR